MRILGLLLMLGFSLPAFAVFYDRPDYFDNKRIYDEVEDIIDILYDGSLTPKDQYLRLMVKDQRLVKIFQSLKGENERRLRETLIRDGKLSAKDVDEVFRTRPVIDGLKLTMENDFIGGTDSGYTNGIRMEVSFNNPKFEAFFRSLGYEHSDLFLLCGQDIYTNTHPHEDGKFPHEAGNAGVMYCGAGVNGYRMDKEHARLQLMDRFETQLGAIGHGAFAEQIQNGFHRMIGDKLINWDFQVGDRVYINVSFERYFKAAEGNIYGDDKPEYNIIVNAGANAGTFTNFINAGVMLNYRLLGSLIDMYVGNKMPPTLVEELRMMSPENRIRKLVCESNWSVNLYVGAAGKFVLNNYRVDDQTDGYFTESTPVVFDLKAGVVVRYKKVFMDFAIVRRTSEWNSTRGFPDDPSHVFASATITTRFDDFSDLGKMLISPVRWFMDSEYRRKVLEERRIKKLIAKEGIRVVYQSDDPKKPAEVLHVMCHK